MLTRRQKEFIRYYVETKNATEAGRLAGYSKKYVSSYVVRLMKNPEILAEIQRLLDERYNLTKEEYIRKTIELHNNETQKSAKVRYWEIVGKSKGYLGEDTRIQIANVLDRSKLEEIKQKRGLA